jgi:DNA primase large subunit
MGPKWNAFSGIKAEEADRLVRLTQGLHSREDGEDFSKKAGVAITAAEVPILARKHFPLCMYTMHHRLEKENQRRFMYDARQQYGLFLKAAGLPIEQALLFWRTMYARRGLNEEQFNKEYAYAIRHNYGKEGKRTDYTPFSCSRIVASGGQDVDKVHGCPYKYLVGKAGTVTAASHHRTKPLEDALVKFGISASEVRRGVDLDEIIVKCRERMLTGGVHTVRLRVLINMDLRWDFSVLRSVG